MDSKNLNGVNLSNGNTNDVISPDNRSEPQVPQSNQPIRIAIVGGGIAGVCLALGIFNRQKNLHAPRIKLHIYETAPRFSEIGAGVAFGYNAQRALFGLDERLRKVYGGFETRNADSNRAQSKSNVSLNGDEAIGVQDLAKETYFRIIMGIDHRDEQLRENEGYVSGKEVCEIFCLGGFSSVHRARFLDEVVKLLVEAGFDMEKDVTFGAKLVNVAEESDGSGIRMMFAGGHSAVTDAIVGCDGIRSTVRRLVLGHDAGQPVFSGKYAYRGLIPMDQAVSQLGDRLARNAHHHVGYDGHVLTFPIEKGKIMNVVAFRTKKDGIWENDQEWIQSATREDMEHDFERWGKHVKAILNMMEKKDMWALFDHPTAATYHKGGRVCLVGDAAHASTPHQGSGAGMAVEDAYLLSWLLAEARTSSDLEAIFEVFESTRKTRTEQLVRSSREQANLYDFQGTDVRDNVQRLAEVLPSRWDWIWDHDVETERMAALQDLAIRLAEIKK